MSDVLGARFCGIGRGCGGGGVGGGVVGRGGHDEDIIV